MPSQTVCSSIYALHSVQLLVNVHLGTGNSPSRHYDQIIPWNRKCEICIIVWNYLYFGLNVRLFFTDLFRIRIRIRFRIRIRIRIQNVYIGSGSDPDPAKSFGSFRIRFRIRIRCTVRKDPDPDSYQMLTDPNPGSPKHRIRIHNTGKKYYNSLSIGSNFFCTSSKPVPISQFCEICGSKKRQDKQIFSPSLLLLLLDPVRDPGAEKDKYQDPGS
jgi:hypothetical protein